MGFQHAGTASASTKTALLQSFSLGVIFVVRSCFGRYLGIAAMWVSYRDLEEVMAVAHPRSDSRRMDETYIKLRGKSACATIKGFDVMRALRTL